MEAFSALLAICAGNSPVPGEFPKQRPVTRGFDVYFDLRPNKRWVNKREAGDLRHNRAHYDVIVMDMICHVTIHKKLMFLFAERMVAGFLASVLIWYADISPIIGTDNRWPVWT